MSNIKQHESYKTLLQEIKSKIQQSQVRAVVAVNQQLILLYWQIGNNILERQKQSNWGDDVIGQLSKDLKKSFPTMKGFSTRNLKYMRRFAREYSNFEIGQQAVAQISWSHNIRILQKCESQEERLWYAQKALQNGWSRTVLTYQIESDLYNRKDKAITNFEKQLPTPQSDMAKESLKDPYK